MTAPKAPPRLYEHICTVFGEMRKRATPQTINGVHTLVYEGHITKLFQQLGLPGPTYSTVLPRLVQMGCIAQLSRGGGSAVSRWSLLDDPTLEGFENSSPKERPTRLQVVESRLQNALERLEILEDQFEETGT